MAKIPRIAQNNRPSSVIGEVSPAPERYLAKAAEAMGKMVDTGLGVAIGREQDQMKAEAAEAKRRDEALAAKMAIVDAAEIGRLDMEYDDEKFKDMAAIEQDASIPWEKKVDVYMKRAQERSDLLAKREDLKTNVQLAAVKNANSSMNSGLAQMHNMVQAGLSRKAKADMTAQFNLAAAGAATFTSAPSVAAYAEEQIGKMATVGRLAFGNEWSAKEQELRNGIASRYTARKAVYDPLALLEEMKTSKFLQSSLTEQEQTAMESAARNGYNKINDTRNLEIASQAFAANETLAKVIGTDDFIDAAATRVKALEEERKLAALGYDGEKRKLLPEDAKKRAKILDEQIQRVKVLQQMNYKQLDPPSTDDADTKQELMTAYDGLMARISDTSERENIDGLLALQDKLELARSSKKILRSTYDTLKTKIFNAFNGVRETQEKKYAWLSSWSAERLGGATLKKHFANGYVNEPIEVQNRVWAEYLREFDAISKERKMTNELAVEIANQVIVRETLTPLPKGAN